MGAILSAVALTVALLTLLPPVATTRIQVLAVELSVRRCLGESVNTTRSSAPNALEVRITKSTSACDGRSSGT
jgi:hypothetical protein